MVSTEVPARSTFRWKFALRYGLFLCVLAELAARAFLTLTAGASLLHPDQVVYSYYPELKKLVETLPEQTSRSPFDVLILGGSVIDQRWSSIDRQLQQRLSSALNYPVRTHNAAARSHTTRDSLFKYRFLKHVGYDLVVVYHAINDARANNCPDSVFRADYSHYAFYRQLNVLERHPERAWVALPYVLDRVISELMVHVLGTELLPEGDPPPAWLTYGSDVKTASSFASNMREIAALGKQKKEAVVLMTFAHYLAPGYTEAAFASQKLDYDRHQSPVSLWGTPESVESAILEHNRQLKSIVAEDASVLFVDQALTLPRGGRYFHDICHLSDAGSEAFVTQLVTDVLPVLSQRVVLDKGR